MLIPLNSFFSIKKKKMCIGTPTKIGWDFRSRMIGIMLILLSFEGLDCSGTTRDKILSYLHEIAAATGY